MKRGDIKLIEKEKGSLKNGKEQIDRCQGIEKRTVRNEKDQNPRKEKGEGGGGKERDKGEGWKRERNKKARKYCQVRGIIMIERKRRKTGSTSLLKQPAQLLQ